jgi:hypothetical protein
MDQVVCVNDDWGDSSYWAQFLKTVPSRGCIYTIRAAQSLTNGHEQKVHYALEEFPASSIGEAWFCCEHFRPVKRTDISELQHLLKPPIKTPKKELV